MPKCYARGYQLCNNVVEVLRHLGWKLNAEMALPLHLSVVDEI
jgi:hypothetical protein